MPFITNYNNHKLKTSIFIEEQTNIEGTVYKKSIDIFNRLEINKLLLYQLLLSNSLTAESLFQSKKIKLERNMPITASYHYFQDCEKLNASYIKSEIKVDSNGDEVIEATELKNSGVFEIVFDKDALESKIDQLLIQIDEVLKNDSLIQQFCKKTYLLKTDKRSKLKELNFTEEQIKLLEDFNIKYKEPLYDTMMDYYSISNKETFNYKLLERMGFHLCKTCSERDKIYNPEDIINFGAYKGERLDFVYTFHPEYIQALIIKHNTFCLNLISFENLHTHSLLKIFSSNNEKRNLFEIMEYDEDFDAMGTAEYSLKEYLLKYTNAYDVEYLNHRTTKNLFNFSELAIIKNNEKVEGYKKRIHTKSK